MNLPRSAHTSPHTFGHHVKLWYGGCFLGTQAALTLTGRLWRDHASFVRRHLCHRCHPAEAPHRIGYSVSGHSVERVAVLRGE